MSLHDQLLLIGQGYCTEEERLWGNSLNLWPHYSLLFRAESRNGHHEDFNGTMVPLMLDLINCSLIFFSSSEKISKYL